MTNLLSGERAILISWYLSSELLQIDQSHTLRCVSSILTL